MDEDNGPTSLEDAIKEALISVKVQLEDDKNAELEKINKRCAELGFPNSPIELTELRKQYPVEMRGVWELVMPQQQKIADNIGEVLKVMLVANKDIRKWLVQWILVFLSDQVEQIKEFEKSTIEKLDNRN